MGIIKFDIENVLSSAFESCRQQEFMTSLNIIQEVMGIPMLAVKCILRQAGDDDVDTSSYCIDEKQLGLFADAYIRKMKNYFISSVRNISVISPEERADLAKFYELFKNEDAKSINRATWSQIDIEHLRSVFMDKIKKLTEERRERRYSFIDLLSNLIEVECKQTSWDVHILPEVIDRLVDKSIEKSSIRIGDHDYPLSNIFPSSLPTYFRLGTWIDDFEMMLNRDEEYILASISENSITYHSPKIHCSKRTKIIRPQVNNILRKIFIAARYHIFAADDNNPYSLVA